VLVGFGCFVVWWLVVGLFGVLVGVLIYYVFHVKLFVVFECVWAGLGVESLGVGMEIRLLDAVEIWSFIQKFRDEKTVWLFYMCSLWLLRLSFGP
jgi:hypothetical protein